MLFVEDVEQDAILVERALVQGGFDVKSERVDTPDALDAALDTAEWDVVISDYSMPRFSAPMALRLIRERGLQLPFIIVSGTVSEDIAVEVLHAGAQDFMSKDKLARLCTAVDRGLREVALRAEKARMEEQLLIADRMASVGTLAASVAHEINNPLAALLANLDFIAEDLEAFRHEGAGMDDRLRAIEEPLRDAREASARVREIARDLKVFSRTEERATGPIDVRRVIESSVRMARTEIRHRAKLVFDLDSTPPVRGNESRLGQVFLNLVVNAAQAIPEGRASSNEIRIAARESAGRVVVEIHDTGVGIPRDKLGRIFEPFFTTKPEGEGTGLGLPICRRIIAGLGGTLDVESELGRGTSFRIELPAADGHSAPSPRAGRPHPGAARGRILVVDDEPMILTAVRRMLAADHDVIGVSTVREAIRRLESGETYDLVLCDLMMPESTGMDLYAAIESLSKDMSKRVIFMTAGVFTGPARAFLEEKPNPRIEKPFDAATLRELVRSELP